MSIKALEFFCGIGGLHIALERSAVDASVVRAYDWDQTACQVYAANHGPEIVTKIDISTLTASSLKSLNADLWLLSPSCQPYTVLNPLAQGAHDPRAKSFIYLIESILPELAELQSLPGFLLIENVAGFETSSTRQMTLDTLKSLGYTTFELILTPLQFGIPNSRLRYYLLARLGKCDSWCKYPSNQLLRFIPGRTRNWVDPRSRQTPYLIEEVEELKVYLDFSLSHEEFAIYGVPEHVLTKWGQAFDIVKPSSRRSCCFTRGYTRLVDGSGSILQMEEELDTKKVFADFSRAKEAPSSAVMILHPLRLRYFTPTELLRLFHLDRRDFVFRWPNTITEKTKYRLIGNSINVRVVTELINFLFE